MRRIQNLWNIISQTYRLRQCNLYYFMQFHFIDLQNTCAVWMFFDMLFESLAKQFHLWIFHFESSDLFLDRDRSNIQYNYAEQTGEWRCWIHARLWLENRSCKSQCKNPILVFFKSNKIEQKTNGVSTWIFQ